MEIRNNTPSFGMAFRKPADMGKFSEYVVSAGPEFIAKRGLARVVKKQANNAHFDMEYRPGQGIAVVPTSEKARAYGYTEDLVTGSKYSDLRLRISKKYFSEDYNKAYSSASRSERFLMTAKRAFAALRLAGHSMIHPEVMLPKSLKAASSMASASESAVERRIAQDAADLAKKQKLEKSIDSIFTSNK